MKVLTAALFENITKFRANVQRELKKELEALAAEIRADLSRRTSYPYRSVPSYLTPAERKVMESTFSKNSSPIQGTEWESQVQMYKTGRHILHDALDVKTVVRDGTAKINFGYSAPTLAAHKEIYRVLFGTSKMQARPFLSIVRDEYQEKFLDATTRALQVAVRKPRS